MTTIPVLSKYGKLLHLAKSWRQARFDTAVQARAAREARDWLADAQSGASLMSGGTLGAMRGYPRDAGRRRPVKTWKSYPHRDGRTTRQWRTV